LAITACLVVAACSGGGSSSGGHSNSATFDLLIGDAPVDSLSSLEVQVTGVHLVRADGSETPNLVGASRNVNLLDLATESALLEVAQARAGDYLGARVDLDEHSIRARNVSGAPVPMRMLGSSVSDRLPATLQASAGDVVKLHLEIEVENSVSDDSNNPGGYVFTPVLELSHRQGTDDLLEEIHGHVIRTDAQSRRLVVDLVDEETGNPYGRIDLLIDDQTVLFDDNSNVFSQEATFFAAAVPGTRVEADGLLRDGGVFLATYVKIENDIDDVAKIEGTITQLDLVSSILRLRIKEVEKGRELVNPVLQGLGNPAEIDVDFLRASFLLEDSNPRTASPSDLAIGQEVKVKFSAFLTPPFPAQEIEIEDENPQFEGTIVDLSGLPGFFRMNLFSTDPAVVSGQVESTSTEVQVFLDASDPIWLKVDHQPILPLAALHPGLKVRVEGALSGSPSAPVVDAADVRVQPGRLEGTVLVGDPSTNTFHVDIDDLKSPFGVPLPDPVVALFANPTQVDGDVSDVPSFFGLLEQLDSGGLEIRLAGIAGGMSGVQCHELEVRIRP
jgi:hypothetical protein